MRSFVDIERTLGGQPPRIGALLARIDAGRGREGLHADQVPELLRSLAGRSRVESITASSALEGIVVDPARRDRLADPAAAVRLRDQDEREFAGYRDALGGVLAAAPPERMGVPLILAVHRDLFRHCEVPGGTLKAADNRIVERDADGIATVIFKPPPWTETEMLLRELVDRYNEALDRDAAHPVLLIGAFVLDFLAIHPLADGNGRVSRILTTQALLERGYGIARYVSVEQRILDTKDAYYDALRRSQSGWHDGAHAIWPWIAYLVQTLADAYAAFEDRVAAERAGPHRLTKQERVRIHVLEHAPPAFTIAQLRTALPGISDQTIRLVLAELRAAGAVAPDGSGRSATWTRRGG
jgi:Fic family protein